ncbi:MAG: hypothetical protein L3J24_14395 [Xanthomonadales bacterium]|nr:hypothetical protein [Xanthomonadales bacterium]
MHVQRFSSDSLSSDSEDVSSDFQRFCHKKLNAELEYTAQAISETQFSVLINEGQEDVYLSRCSFSQIDGKVTCDDYEVDKVELDEISKIKKYYVFGAQFGVQLFSNLTFVENNGRGDIAYGQCVVVAL